MKAYILVFQEPDNFFIAAGTYDESEVDRKIDYHVNLGAKYIGKVEYDDWEYDKRSA